MFSWFMQLNPARGRKLGERLGPVLALPAVYAAQPREGTETKTRWWWSFFRFMQLNPARGRKH